MVDLSEEPVMGTVLIDTSGSAWQRDPFGWCIIGGDSSWSYNWEQMVEMLLNEGIAPTEIWKHVAEDPRLPMILYTPPDKPTLSGLEDAFVPGILIDGLPVVVIDDDFLEYLYEESYDHDGSGSLDINILAIHYKEWEKENT